MWQFFTTVVQDIPLLIIALLIIFLLVACVAYFTSWVDIDPKRIIRRRETHPDPANPTGPPIVDYAPHPQRWGGWITLATLLIMLGVFSHYYYTKYAHQEQEAKKTEIFHILEEGSAKPGNPFSAKAEFGSHGEVTLTKEDFSPQDAFVVKITSEATANVKSDGEKSSITNVKAIQLKTDLDYTTFPLAIVTYDGTDEEGEEYEDMTTDVKIDWNAAQSKDFAENYLRRVMDVGVAPGQSGTPRASATKGNTSNGKFPIPKPRAGNKAKAKKKEVPTAIPVPDPSGTNPMPKPTGS